MPRAVVVCAFLPCALAVGQTHQVPVADAWFPKDPAALKQLLDNSFAAAENRSGHLPPRKHLLAVIAPHAALAYSGPVAAAAYSRIGKARNVIVLGFSHRRPLRGVAVPLLEAYQTPLGVMPVNKQAVRELGFPRIAEGEVCDHSLENQLPFIQRVAPAAGIVPVYVGELSDTELAIAAAKLAARLRGGDVIVASSDFTHYGQSYGYTPFANDALLPRRLQLRFADAVETISSLDVAAFDAFMRETRETICGWGPIRLLLAALARLKEDVFLSPESYMMSGELTRDFSTSVTYGALAFYPASAWGVAPADQAKLLRSARETLNHYLETGDKKAQAPVPALERDGELEQRGGVFVTIKKNGQLRGCIGELNARQPVWAAVADRTIAAASEDVRFPPLTANEGPVSLEISLLTPMKKIAGWKDLRLGQGTVLLLDGRWATFLPQIAGENGWGRDTLLQQLSRKAGLLPDAYKSPRAKLYVYDAQVFGEEKRETAGAGAGR